ncbi:MAG: hypothetical protein OXI25_06920 [Chloroflexota bacterium]|nr:hypothetical protein [Chloroflexota bacterium]
MPDNRYEREIEDILDKAGDDLPGDGKQAKVARRRPRPRAARPARAAPNIGALLTWSRLLIGGVILIVLSLVLDMSLLLYAGLGVIVIAYFIFFNRPRRSTEKRWRGERIEEDEGGLPFWRRGGRR